MKPHFILRKSLKRKNRRACMASRLRRLKAEMEGVSKEQKMIKQGQLRVGEKLKAVQEECEQLKRETKQIMEQSAYTQFRLALMFNILKAREQGDNARAAQLTQLLREIVARK